MRIRNNEYAIPSRVSRSAANLIQRLLSERPEDRPSLTALYKDSFFTKGFFPRSLPPMSCMTPPKFSPSNSQSKYSRTNRTGLRRSHHVAGDTSPRLRSGNEDGVKHLKNALSNLNFQGNDKTELRKKCENVESGVESQDSNGHELSNSLGKYFIGQYTCFLCKVLVYVQSTKGSLNR